MNPSGSRGLEKEQHTHQVQGADDAMEQTQRNSVRKTRNETLIIMKEKSIKYGSKTVKPQETLSLTKCGKQKRKSLLRKTTL